MKPKSLGYTDFLDMKILRDQPSFMDLRDMFYDVNPIFLHLFASYESYSADNEFLLKHEYGGIILEDDEMTPLDESSFRHSREH